MEQAVIDNDLRSFIDCYLQNRHIDFRIVESIIEHDRITFIDYVCQRDHLVVNENKYRLLSSSCKLGNYKIFLYLLTEHMEMPPCPNMIFLKAISGGSVEIVKYMEDLGILDSILKSRYSHLPIVAALCGNRKNMIEYLMKRDVPVKIHATIECIKYKGEMGKYLDSLRFMHDLDIKRDINLRYNWGCSANRCIHCLEVKKEKLMEYWIMESEIYVSQIQWLPVEMLDDTLLLL